MAAQRRASILAVLSLLVAGALVSPASPAVADDTVTVSGVVTTNSGTLGFGTVDVRDLDGTATVGGGAWGGPAYPDGIFRLDMPPGTYDLRFEGWRTFEGMIAGDQESFSVNVYGFTVSEDTELNVSIPETAMTVHMVDSSGQPAPGTASLECTQLRDDGLGPAWGDADRHMVSSASGTGALQLWGLVLKPGSLAESGCQLTLTPEGGTRRHFPVTLTASGPNETTVEVEPSALTDALIVSGKLVAPMEFDSGSVEAWEVTDPQATAATARVETTGPDNSYTMRLKPGTYQFYFRASDDDNAAGGPPDELYMYRQVEIHDRDWVACPSQAGQADCPDQLLDGDLGYEPRTMEQVGYAPVKVHPVGLDGQPVPARMTLDCARHITQTWLYGSLRDTVVTGQTLFAIPTYGPVFCTLTVTDQAAHEAHFDGIQIPVAGLEVTVVVPTGVLLPGAPATSADHDGVSDLVESLGPNSGDGNGDGTPDNKQANVTSLPANGATPGSGHPYVTVAGPSGSQLTTVTTVDPSSLATAPPLGTTLPAGLVAFTLDGVTAGSDQTISVYGGSTAGVTGYAKYNATTGVWSVLPAERVHVFTDHVDITLSDGGVGDADGVANGRIKDPGGMAKILAQSDLTPPVVTGTPTRSPNSAGWYAGDVRIQWKAVDPSGVAAQPADTTVTSEGSSLTAQSPLVCDKAIPVPNCGRGSVAGLKIDRTAPALSVTGVTNGATYTLGAMPTPGCSASDALSGLGAPCKGAAVGGNANKVGAFVYGAAVADRAGNPRVAAAAYRSIYRFDGFQAPLNDPALTPGTPMSVVKAGTTIPVVITLKRADGQVVVPVSKPVWVTPVKGARTTAAVNETTANTAGTTGSAFVAKPGKWQFDWSTKGLAAGYVYRIGVSLDDGTTHYLSVGVR